MSSTGPMSQAAFAAFCGVSRMAISKHKKNGRLILIDDKVDPLNSLIALEGHLEEGKRRAALARLGQAPSFVESHDLDAAQNNQNRAAPPAGAVQQVFRSDKLRKEKTDADMAEIALEKMKGNLVDRFMVEELIADATRSFWSLADQSLGADIDAIATELELTNEQITKIRALLKSRKRRLQQEFSDMMSAKAIEPMNSAAA